jgi:two-component system, NarL family, invasion response regulator UvrY
MIRVLIADDHPVVRRGLRQILEEAGDIVVGAEVGCPGEVLREVDEQRYGVVLLDISLPGGNGIDLIRELRRERPQVRVLILTAHPEAQYGVRAIKAGAAGFLNKESAPNKLVEAIRKIASGGRYVSPSLAEALASVVAGDASLRPHEQLSDREFEILKLLAGGRTVSQVAAELSLSVKTVSTHRTRMLEKMNMQTTSEMMHYALREGLVE